MQQTNNAQESQTQNELPTYTSYSTFITFLDWLRDMPVIPDQIDRSLWESKFAGSTGAQLMSGLRFLNLLEGDRPRQELKDLVAADKSGRKPLIRTLLENAYGQEFVDDLAKKTPGLVEKKLHELGTTTGTHKKALSFFVNAARENDVTVPASIGKMSRNRSAKPRSTRQTPQHRVLNETPSTLGRGSGGQGGETNPAKGNLNLHMAVLAMLQDLERLAPSWSLSDRERWFTTFQTTLDYAYPANNEEADTWEKTQ